MNRRIGVALLLALGACSGAATPSVSPQTTRPPATATSVPAAPAIRAERATVTRVVDGDTAHMRMSDGRTEKVRFIGVDTPESTTRLEPFGPEASAFTKRRLDRATVYLELDAGHRDRYGRLLAYVWLRRPRTGDAAEVRAYMFNAILVSEGYAQLLTVPPNVRYVEVFRALQGEARFGRRGLWRR